MANAFVTLDGELRTVQEKYVKITAMEMDSVLRTLVIAKMDTLATTARRKIVKLNV
jgi:hypothetical protein